MNVQFDEPAIMYHFLIVSTNSTSDFQERVPPQLIMRILLQRTEYFYCFMQSLYYSLHIYLYHLKFMAVTTGFTDVQKNQVVFLIEQVKILNKHFGVSFYGGT